MFGLLLHPPVIVEPGLLLASSMSATACVLSGITQHKIQGNLRIAATYAGLGGTQARPTGEPMLAVPNGRPGATEREVWAH